MAQCPDTHRLRQSSAARTGLRQQRGGPGSCRQDWNDSRRGTGLPATSLPGHDYGAAAFRQGFRTASGCHRHRAHPDRPDAQPGTGSGGTGSRTQSWDFRLSHPMEGPRYAMLLPRLGRALQTPGGGDLPLEPGNRWQSVPGVCIAGCRPGESLEVARYPPGAGRWGCPALIHRAAADRRRDTS
ncbi:hypothetical protein D3C72_1282510 [compost metagenome]